MYQIFQILWKLELVFRGIDCFFVGHVLVEGEPAINEADFCYECLCDWPQDKLTLPHLLTRCFGWLVEREWRWFYRFDFWIGEKLGNSLPDWWEY